MRFFMTILCLALGRETLGQTSPDFKKIFKEISRTNSINEAMSIRTSYLKEMRGLTDFNALTDLEKLEEGEEFFEHYRTRMSEFIVVNLKDFIVPERKDEMNVLVYKILPKVRVPTLKSKVVELGLAYVEGCEELKGYAGKINDPSLWKHARRYCSKSLAASNHLVSVLFHPRTLESGRWDEISFRGRYYVKRIFLSAEGSGEDAYFDVMVNGVVKGTIYVPGKDPSYVITVEDEAESLVLRSFRGNARIETVILEVE